jgi:hypothetical protein
LDCGVIAISPKARPASKAAYSIDANLKALFGG